MKIIVGDTIMWVGDPTITYTIIDIDLGRRHEQMLVQWFSPETKSMHTLWYGEVSYIENLILFGEVIHKREFVPKTIQKHVL